MSKSEPFPTLLTKADAMLFAADKLERMVTDLELLALIGGIIKDKPDAFSGVSDPKALEAKENLQTSLTGVVDASIQKDAMRQAAAEIRSFVNETKLADARASMRGIAPA